MPAKHSQEDKKISLDLVSRLGPTELSNWLGKISISEHDSYLLDRPTLGIVSSHLERNSFASSRFQRKLETALKLARRQGSLVLYSADTPFSIAIETACQHLGVESCRLSKAEGKHREADQITSLSSVPTLVLERHDESPHRGMDEFPFLDRAVVCLSQCLFVLELRDHGKMARLLNQRLASNAFPPGSVFLAWSRESSISGHSQSLKSWLDRGMIGWIVPDLADGDLRFDRRDYLCPRLIRPSAVVPIMRLSQLPSTAGRFLVHCTRARQGPWPDQSVSQFYDEIFLQPWESSPTPFQSLRRILQTQRLVATSFLKSQANPSVSFSACSIQELLSARRFESHLARWDWEPYGLLICRDWLAENGCRAVQYVHRKEFQKLSRDETADVQPFDDSGKGRDWRVEQEWRLHGDLRLYKIPFSKAIVFVRSLGEARCLNPWSRWPICVVES